MIVLIALLLLLPGPARADDVVVSVDNTRGNCGVRGVFVAPVPGPIAWEVLTDYDSIGTFVRSVRSSRLERQADGRQLLRQDAVGGLFLFRRRMQVLLEIEESPESRIQFRDVLGKDFRTYIGEWRIGTDSLGTRVSYEIEAEPRSGLSRALCRGPLRNAARDLLTQVRAEMIRRSQGAR